VQVRCHLHRPAIVIRSNHNRGESRRSSNEQLLPIRSALAFPFWRAGTRSKIPHRRLRLRDRIRERCVCLSTPVFRWDRGKLFVKPLVYGLESAGMAMRVLIIQIVAWAVDDRLCKTDQHGAGGIEDGDQNKSAADSACLWWR